MYRLYHPDLEVGGGVGDLSHYWRKTMFLFKWITANQLLAFVVLNIVLVDLVQAISVYRKGFGQIVSLAGYYGDRAFVFMILIISSVLVKNGVEFKSSLQTQTIVVCAIYVVSVIIAQKYLPPPTIEDKYHNFVILPLYAIILICGGLKTLGRANPLEYLGMFACLGIWLALLLVDIKHGRLNQKAFMEALKLPV